MKLVKKILRLFPLISLFCFFIAICFNKVGYSTPVDLVNFLNFESGFFDEILDIYLLLIPEGILNWFTVNISSNYFLLLSLSILFYELYLSISFIMFDFINIIFSWANKFIDRGSNYE